MLDWMYGLIYREGSVCATCFGLIFESSETVVVRKLGSIVFQSD